MIGHIIDATLGLLLGGYLLLIASGQVALGKSPEDSAKWRESYGTLAGIAGFIVFLGGVYHFIRIFV